MEVQRGEIRIEQLVKSFGAGVVAVDGIDLLMPPGEFCVSSQCVPSVTIGVETISPRASTPCSL